MPLPNFVIIGAAKGGTTSAYLYLKQHPQVFMSPIKETNFFIYDGQNPLVLRSRADRRGLFPIKSLDEYRSLFVGASGEKALGEASPSYLIDPCAAARIRHHIPRVRLIAILRDPADRAYSAYAAHSRDRRDRRSFAEAIDDETNGKFQRSRVFGPGQYIQTGFYTRHLKHYFRLFDRSQIAVHLFDDLQADAAGLMGKLFRFLEVDEEFVPDTSLRHNISGISNNKFLRPLLRKSAFTRTVRRFLPGPLGRRAEALQHRWRDRASLEHSPMPPHIRRELVAGYRQDILELQDLIQRDLSRWLVA